VVKINLPKNKAVVRRPDAARTGNPAARKRFNSTGNKPKRW
jgi:hypothetical protein